MTKWNQKVKLHHLMNIHLILKRLMKMNQIQFRILIRNLHIQIIQKNLTNPKSQKSQKSPTSPTSHHHKFSLNLILILFLD